MGRIEPAPRPADPLAEGEELSLSSLRENVEDWAAGRSAFLRLPLLLYFAYVLFHQLKDREEYGSLLFGGITFLIHEAGHVMFGFAPDFVTIAAGSFVQLAVPLLVGLIFLRQPDYFGVTVAATWLSYSLINLSFYIGDARKQILPLLGVGSGEPIHDWNYILTRLGLLNSDLTIAALVRGSGALLAVLSLAVALWMCLVMWEKRGTRARSFS